jgi:hypothetical protein
MLGSSISRWIRVDAAALLGLTLWPVHGHAQQLDMVRRTLSGSGPVDDRLRVRPADRRRACNAGHLYA